MAAQLNTYVTFFRIAVSTTPLAPALFRSFIYGAFFAPVVILFVESRKRSNPLWIQCSPLIVGLVAQVCSAMFTLPLWFAAYLMFGPGQSSPSRATGDRGNDLRAVLPATVVGYVVPALLMDNPLLPVSRQTQDWANAIWQLFPVTIALLIPLFDAVLPRTTAPAAAVEQSTLLWTSALCRLAHLSTILELWHYATQHKLGLGEMYQLALWPVRKVSPLQRSTYEFLLKDIAIGSLAMAIFILLAPGDPYKGKGKTSRWWIALVMVGSAPVQGLGAALAWGWRTRRREAVRGRTRAE